MWLQRDSNLFSVRFQAKWLRIRVSLQTLDFVSVSSKEFFDIQATI